MKKTWHDEDWEAAFYKLEYFWVFSRKKISKNQNKIKTYHQMNFNLFWSLGKSFSPPKTIVGDT